MQWEEKYPIISIDRVFFQHFFGKDKQVLVRKFELGDFLKELDKFWPKLDQFWAELEHLLARIS